MFADKSAALGEEIGLVKCEPQRGHMIAKRIVGYECLGDHCDIRQHARIACAMLRCRIHAAPLQFNLCRRPNELLHVETAR